MSDHRCLQLFGHYPGWLVAGTREEQPQRRRACAVLGQLGAQRVERGHGGRHVGQGGAQHQEDHVGTVQNRPWRVGDGQPATVGEHVVSGISVFEAGEEGSEPIPDWV